MQEEDVYETVFVISDRDISIVQGSTEMYYLTSYFAENTATHVFAPTSQAIGEARMHSHPFAGAVGTILLNVFFLPYWFFTLYYYKPDVVYCYQNVLAPPLLAKYLFNATIVHDLRSDPCDQAREFSAESLSTLKQILLKISEVCHTYVLPRSDLIVTLSEELKVAVVRNYGISPSKTYILPLGVDNDKFEYERKEKDCNEPLKFIYIGSVHPRRGIAKFVDGLLQIPEDTRDRIEFHIYGDGDQNHINSIKDKCDCKQYTGFKYHGRVPHNQIPQALQEADVAVSPLPRLEAYQVSSPAKIFEYLAAGLPILATSITPHTRILTESCAYFVEPVAHQYASKVEAIVKNQDQRMKKSSVSKEMAQSHDWSKRFSKLSKQIASIHCSS